MATVNLILTLPDEAAATSIDDIQSPLWNWKDGEEMDRKRHKHRFCQSEATTGSEELWLPSFEFAGVLVNQRPDISAMQLPSREGKS
jgi:hypothetical protein